MSIIDLVNEEKYKKNSYYFYLNEANKPQQDNSFHFQMGPLNTERFVKVNELEEVYDPVFFVRDGVPTSNGLLSNEIFGITKDERANIFAYIDLHEWFLHPLVYKIWSRMDNRIKEIVHGTKNFSINEHGDFVEDENGSNGVKFLKNNIDKIKIKSTESRKRDKNIEFIKKYKDIMFIKKFIVIPPYYRDVQSRSGNVGVGALNKYYSSLIVSVRSLTETRDYGLSMSNAVSGRIQETMVQIYDSICGTGNAESDGVGLSKKSGLIRNAVMSKTSDYGTRLVLSAPNLKVEKLEDLMVDMDHSALPLASACTNFKLFVIYWIKRFFENELSAGMRHQIMDRNGNVSYEEVKDPLITFSEENIEAQIKRFVHGYSNRFAPVEVPLMDGRISYMVFKGHQVKGVDVASKSAVGASPLIERRLTWCDVLYMAAEEASRDKAVLITRFPMDSAYNQFPTKVRISTIKDTENVFVNGTYYQFYPRIREKDIGSNTSRYFIDTFQMCNLYLKAIGGDYDGDQVSVKAAYSIEANEELIAYMNSKKNYLDLGGINMRVASNEAIQSLYSMTRILPESEKKLTNPVF